MKWYSITVWVTNMSLSSHKPPDLLLEIVVKFGSIPSYQTKLSTPQCFYPQLSCPLCWKHYLKPECEVFHNLEESY